MNTIDAALLAALGEVDPATLTRLHTGLESAAESAGELDVAYTTYDSPVGPLLLAATDAGLLRVAYEIEDHDRVLETISARISPRILWAPRRLESAICQLDEYFAGRRTAFDLPLDLGLSTAFRRLVQRQLAHIAYGHTQSYGRVAAAVGNPKAVRAVGTACATNPLPIVLPCHRVLRSDGSLGGYAGGPATKAVLLKLESAA